MNRATPRGDFRHRSSDPGGASRSGGAVPGSGRLVGGVAGDRRQAGTDALSLVRSSSTSLHGLNASSLTPPGSLRPGCRSCWRAITMSCRRRRTSIQRDP